MLKKLLQIEGLLWLGLTFYLYTNGQLDLNTVLMTVWGVLTVMVLVKGMLWKVFKIN